MLASPPRVTRNILAGLFSAALSLVIAGASAPAAARQPGSRVALVVGNGAYRAVEHLANPGNDARLIARTLQSAGFTLIGGTAQLDLDKAHFDRAIQDFGRAAQGADVALFYYSGHGMQVQGENWLVPVDANPGNARDLDFQMIDASLVLRQMEGAGTNLNLVILDACRNNPFASRGVRGTQGGLAEIHAPEGTLISYATQPGNVARDGEGADSPYTAALAEAIRRPGQDIFQVFNQVGLAVKAATGGEQQPWLASSPIAGNFYFFDGPVSIAPAPAPDPDVVFWQSISNSTDPADFGSYLQKFPNGRFADLARRRTAALSLAATPGSVAAMSREPPVDHHVFALSGRAARVAGVAAWDTQCAPKAVPRLQVIQPPEHGTIALRDDTFTITSTQAGAGQCIGQLANGAVVSYTSRSGFHGTDHFGFSLSFDNGRTVDHQATVDVR